MPGRRIASLYALLGVAPDATQPELTRAFRRRARELHPDLAADADHHAFAALTHAYRVLSDPARRASYDTSVRESDNASPTSSAGVAVRVRHVDRPARPESVSRRSPIIAGPTFVFPNRPVAGR